LNLKFTHFIFKPLKPGYEEDASKRKNPESVPPAEKPILSGMDILPSQYFVLQFINRQFEGAQDPSMFQRNNQL